MKRLLLAALIALAPSTALAFYVQPPPARYAKPYGGPLQVIHGTIAETDQRCGGGSWACQQYRGNVCVVWLPHRSEVGARNYARLRQHELAHCNGWPGHYAKKRADVITTRDGGGNIVTLYQRYYSEWNHGRNRHVIDGYCGSACTLKLAFPNTCVTPRARLMFHHGYYPLGPWEMHSATGTAYMMAIYPPYIQRWLRSKGGLQYTKFWLTSKEAVKLGVKAC